MEVRFGDCKDIMKQMVLEGIKIQTCVTSPPYFALRNYSRDSRQIGVETSLNEYIANLVEVFDLVKQLLTNDGTLWLNLGDTYATSTKGKGEYKNNNDKQSTHKNSFMAEKKFSVKLKNKNLIGVPWRVAFALQENDWYLRSDIIWHKPNPMPESVRDRPTNAHEHIFLLSKSDKYYYDSDAIREKPKYIKPHSGNKRFIQKKKHRSSGEGSHTGFSGKWDKLTKQEAMANGANKRDVWTVSSSTYKSNHVAKYPERLIEPCILAGSRVGDTVLDPFLGSGTTGRVAVRLKRQCIGIEINKELFENKSIQTNLFLET